MLPTCRATVSAGDFESGMVMKIGMVLDFSGVRWVMEVIRG